MEISEVRIRLVENKNDRLKAFCSVTLDNDFVVRDIKIIEGGGRYIVAMPSKKRSDRCDKCGGKNHLRANYCNNCGSRLSEHRSTKGITDNTKLHADIAHPINPLCREKLQSQIVKAFQREIELSQQPGYQPFGLNDEFTDLI